MIPPIMQALSLWNYEAFFIKELSLRNDHSLRVINVSLNQKKMTQIKRSYLVPFCLFLLAALVFGISYTAKTQTASHSSSPNQGPDLSGWPDASQKAAKMIIAKYGMPNEQTSTMLVWYNNRPWKRTVIYKMESTHSFPIDHKDVMEQTIDYKGAPKMADELAEYDGSVTYRRTDGELSAKCDKEGANFLAINLANDVVMGKKSIDDARKFYAKTIKEFVLEKKMNSYMESFQFTVASGGTGDPDKHAVDKEDHEKIQKMMAQTN